MIHSVTKAASNPAVKATSTTSGTVSTERVRAASQAPPAKAQARDGRGPSLTGKSTTSNKAHALSIQLTRSGTTAVDGLLVKGFNHGKIKHRHTKALRTWAAYFSN
jgi:hypothetical protein